MIHRLIELSLRNRGLVIATYLGLAAWGYWALLHTPLDAIPDLSENQVIVFTDWTGRSPQEVEDQVTYPLTVNLQGLPGVKAVRSFSNFGFSMIFAIFEDNVDLYFARTRVLERLNLVGKSLPPAWRRRSVRTPLESGTSSGTPSRAQDTTSASYGRFRTGSFDTSSTLCRVSRKWPASEEKSSS